MKEVYRILIRELTVIYYETGHNLIIFSKGEMHNTSLYDFERYIFNHYRVAQFHACCENVTYLKRVSFLIRLKSISAYCEPSIGCEEEISIKGERMPAPLRLFINV